MSTHTPPTAGRVPHETTFHGRTFVDEYYWLRERENPEVTAYLEAENAYTDLIMEPTAGLQEQLYGEMVGRMRQTDMNVPVRRDNYLYYSRTEEGKQYPIYCRREGSMEEKEEILLDLNAEAEKAGSDYIGLGIYEVSRDHNFLAFALDTDGSEEYLLRIKDLRSGELLPETILFSHYSLEWAADNRTFFYAIHDRSWRSYKIMRHRLGDDPADDREILHETDERFGLFVYATKDGDYLVLHAYSSETSEERLLRADDPDGEFALIEPRRQGMRYSVEHRNGTLYIRTNDNAPNFRLMTAPAADPGYANWAEFVPGRADVMLSDIEMFADYLALQQRREGLPGLTLYRFDSGEWREIDFPEQAYMVHAAANPEYHSRTLRFRYMSLTTPESVYDYDMETGERRLLKRKEVLGGYDPEAYRTERIFAESPDGERIPVSLVYRIDLFKKDGGNPALLYAYGSYGSTMDPWFDSNRLSLLDRGFVFAIAHVRGGQEMGRSWYESGKLLNKKNTFTDFIACGEKLVAEGYTRREKLAIMGGSAGGLLIGAVINLRPDLAAAAVAQVPFVDVINTMMDSSLPLTVGEYEEWGDPNVKEYFDYILSYSPYDNVQAADYPNLLVTAGLNDPRVQYWEPAKWTARLRATKSGENLLLLKTNMGAGHGGPAGRYDHLKEVAFVYAFLLTALGEVQ